MTAESRSVLVVDGKIRPEHVDRPPELADLCSLDPRKERTDDHLRPRPKIRPERLNRIAQMESPPIVRLAERSNKNGRTPSLLNK